VDVALFRHGRIRALYTYSDKPASKCERGYCAS